MEKEVMKLWLLLALLLQPIAGKPSPQYVASPYNGSLITLQYRELSYTLSRFLWSPTQPGNSCLGTYTAHPHP